MSETETTEVKTCKDKKSNSNAGVNNTLYGMGFIGALIYFMMHAVSFWTVITGIFKAIFWPAFVVFKVLEILKM